MNRIPIVFCFLLLSNLVSFSQDSVVTVQKGQILKYRKGYLVTVANDTVRGLIYHERASMIFFIREDQKVKLKIIGDFPTIPNFTADDGKIKSFYRNGISYTIQSIPPDDRQVFLTTLEDGRITLYGHIYNYSDKGLSDQIVNPGMISSMATGDRKTDEEYYDIRYFIRKLPDGKLIDVPTGEKKFQNVFFPLIRDNPAFVKALRDQPADFYHLRDLIRQYNSTYGKQ